MNRISTDRAYRGKMLCAWILATLILGVALCYAGIRYGIGICLPLAAVCGMANIMPLLASAVVWAYGNQLHKGIRYAWKHYTLILRLRRQLLEAGIYTEIKIGAVKLAKLPWITVDFAKDYKTGTIYIANSIRYHGKLGDIDISPSLGQYVVEQTYLTDDANHYRYDFFDSSLERRLTFSNPKDFKEYARSREPYELFIDAYTCLPLTHQLLVGQTGSGKSYALYGYLLQMVNKPIEYHLYFCDPKESGIAILGDRLSPDATAVDFEAIVALLETFVTKMRERQAELKKHLLKKLDGDYRDFGLSPHILIFDEYADFALFLQTKDKKLRDHVNNLVSQIVLKGRQAGFYLWVVMQQAGSNNIPTYVRDNLPWKVVLGNAEDQTYVTAFGAGVDIPERKMRVGDGVYTYPAVASKPKLCSFLRLDFDILDALNVDAQVMQ